ncbi:hypothetical protein EON65_25385 [archaeon]|nr:MAG: hypothetical protein EON65_25385 [archaeon]
MEGILLEDVGGSEELSLFNLLFCVHLQRQYSAARELNAFLAKYEGDAANVQDNSELKYLQALEVKYFTSIHIIFATVKLNSDSFCNL